MKQNIKFVSRYLGTQQTLPSLRPRCLSAGDEKRFMQSVAPLPRTLLSRRRHEEKLVAIATNLDLYETILRLKEQPHNLRLAAFITCIREESLEIFNRLFGDAEATHGDMEFVLLTLETHFIGIINATYDRYAFNQGNQQASETFETCLIVLRQLVRTCNYR